MNANLRLQRHASLYLLWELFRICHFQDSKDAQASSSECVFRLGVCAVRWARTPIRFRCLAEMSVRPGNHIRPTSLGVNGTFRQRDARHMHEQESCADGAWQARRMTAKMPPPGGSEWKTRLVPGGPPSPPVLPISITPLYNIACLRWSGAYASTDSRSMSPRSQESFMTDTKTHWCLLAFRCVNCGRNEASAEDSFAGVPHEDQISAKIYQASCRACGWKGEVCGLSSVKIRSGVERRKGIRNKQRNTLDG